MPSDKTQLSTWVTSEEEEEIRAYAKTQQRSVSQVLRLAVLSTIRQPQEAR